MSKVLFSAFALLAASAAFATPAAAAQDRMSALEACVAQAKQQVADPNDTRSSAVQTARTRVYSSCMKKKGLRP